MPHSISILEPEPLSEALEALCRLLDEMAGRYETARRTLIRKRDLLISRQAETLKNGELQATDRELLAVSRQVARLDQERRQLQVRMGCPDWTLGTLIEALRNGIPAASPEWTQAAAQNLARTRERLETVLRETDRLTREVRGLLELSLGWIRETVDILTAAATPDGTGYTAQGTGSTKRAIVEGCSTISRSA
jgi:hypothetical protein